MVVVLTLVRLKGMAGALEMRWDPLAVCHWAGIDAEIEDGNEVHTQPKNSKIKPSSPETPFFNFFHTLQNNNFKFNFKIIFCFIIKETILIVN